MRIFIVPIILATLAPGPVAADPNDFACDLYRKLGQDDGNIFFSPLSVQTALAMTWAGARGITAQEMADVLHFQGEPNKVHQTNSALLAELGGKQVAIANRLWPSKQLKLLGDFLDLTENYYGARPQPLDFVTQTEVARQEINQWAEKNTAGMIKDLLHKDDLTAQTLLVLTNAIYFKGSWASQFDPAKTRTGPFQLTSGKTVDTEFMDQLGSFSYARHDDVQVLEMPYADSDLAFVAILPNEQDDLAKVEKSLTPEKIDQWLAGIREQTVNVMLPRFEMTQRYPLREILIGMGMPSAFGGGADFSGMTPGKIFIDQVIHQAKIMVNEEGTEAAAATAVIMRKSMPLSFRADHPFLMLIRDTKSGSILFMGRMASPI